MIKAQSSTYSQSTRRKRHMNNTTTEYKRWKQCAVGIYRRGILIRWRGTKKVSEVICVPK